MKRTSEFNVKIVLERVAIESGDMKCLHAFMGILKNPFSFNENVEILVDGYNFDERELFEIPKVKYYIREIDKIFPYWTFFINKETYCLRWITYCLMDNVIFHRNIGYVELDNKEFGNILVKFFDAQNKIFNALDLSDEQNNDLTNRVLAYFGI